LLVAVESLKHLDAEVEMASIGVAILLLTVVVDYTIIRQLRGNPNPIIIGLREDIKADVTNSLGGLIALSVIAMGAPMVVDKVIAIFISIVLMAKGVKMFHDNMLDASQEHDDEHTAYEEGLGLNTTQG
jgi:divalent metal cation (Fe/Co/Zn/Cd) transporter